ncbi:MAG: uroporphyrinogen decarboxylase [Parachlamydiales bacterium]|jgi:uroporphyrinogen decarboxylase
MATTKATKITQEYSYIQAAKCQPVQHFPIWLMRQAGRYMKAYQKMREKYSMKQLITTPELACEVTLQPIEAFHMDAAIIFSDILTVPDALGIGIEFIDQKGPVAKHPIRSQKDVDRLRPEEISVTTSYVMEAIKLAKEALKPHKTPLIGFAGAPFTVASYIVGKGEGHDLNEFMGLISNQPALIKSLLDKLTEATIIYLNEQIKAGVDAIQIFESWCNVLSWNSFKELSLPYLKQVISRLDNPNNIPVTVFGTTFSVFYPLIEGIGADVISIDSRIDISNVRKVVKPTIALQGNLDPYFLLCSKSVLEKEVMSILKSMQGTKGYIFNLGHGVTPNVPEDNVKFLVDLVKNFPAG